MKRPVIGVCAALEVVRWGPWEVEADLLPRTYTRSVQDAGAQAVILPPDDSTAESPEEALDLIDGLILAGGSDVDPGSYGQRPHPEIGGTNPARDRFELALLQAALGRDLPLLAICRGMEVLNIARGGTLEQHIERLDLHRHTPGAFCDHEVRLEPGSLAARAVGTGRSSIKSHHHQALADLGEGLVPSGWSLPDELVEAVELPDFRFVLGVLWHPEQDERSCVVGALVAASSGLGADARPQTARLGGRRPPNEREESLR